MTLLVQDFVEHYTTLRSLPFLPELTLHLGGELEELWGVLQKETGDPDLPPPFWAFAWVGGQGLARYILDHPEVVRGKKVLDFASGSGLVGIAAALSGARSVTCCDIDPLALRVCTMNAAVNKAKVDLLEDVYLKRAPKGYDVILAGDVFYEHLMAHRAMAWFRLCREAGQDVLIGDPGRAYVPNEGVRTLATYVVPALLALEDKKEREVSILTLP